MNNTTLRALFAVGALAATFAAHAETIATTDGMKTVIESVAPLGQNLRYLSGGDGLVGVGGTWPVAGTPADAMDSTDHMWLQFLPAIHMTSGNTLLDRVFAVPGVDHGPNPQENLEFIIWGSSDDSTWEEGKILSIYRDGFDTANTPDGHSDDYTSMWGFSKGYNYFLITDGDHLDPHYGSEGEGEVDSLNAVPEPASMVAIVAGLAAVARKRRK